MQQASKVGSFVILFVLLLFGAYSVVGRSWFAPPSQKLLALFPDAGGINPGVKVLMAGVKVGEVTAISLDQQRRAVLELSIDSGIKVPKGTVAVLPTSFIGIGDNPVSLVPPSGGDSGTLVAGSRIEGKRVGALEGLAPNLMPSLNTTLDELNKTLVATQNLMGDKELKGELASLLSETRSTLKQFGQLASGANSTLLENRAAIHTSLSRFALAMKDVQEAASTAAKMIADPQFKNQTNAILANLADSSKRASALMASVQDVIDDPDLKRSIDQTLANAAAMSESGAKIAQNTEKITGNGIAASENVIEITEKVSKLADDARAVLEKLQKFFDRPASVGPLEKLSTQTDTMHDTEDSRNRVDFRARYPIKDGTVHVGVFDAFESNRLTLQLGKPFGKGAEYRYGVYGGKPGFGVDFPLTPKVRFRGDAYGLNDSRLDVRAEFDFRNDILGIIGVNRLGNRNHLMVGFGIKK